MGEKRRNEDSKGVATSDNEAPVHRILITRIKLKF